ncbi:transmembrane protein 249-like isoform X1 [Scyliorhinus canicula]|uniref:transmembrane protein 249-like isoform X1 n=1 Tax=Scyliorhinus canicula TaxID=7830 RepID=UPI0018F48041|nr:transmembrane protein 249-like isoform X1 [Scyliorhinus canicula]
MFMQGLRKSWQNVFKSAEEILHRNLKSNPFHPFRIRQPNVYELNYLNNNLWIGIAMLIVSLIASALYLLSYMMGGMQFAGFFIFLILLGLWLIITSIGRRNLIIDLDEDTYEFYIHRYLQHKGTLDEVYIRLTAQKSGQGKFYYKLILNGTYIEVISLTGIKFSTNREKLEKLGMRLAAKLNLNYFDCVDLTANHVIRHWPQHKSEDPAEKTKDCAVCV